MIPGYNHNVKYKDRVFHVQTEDSGIDNPHIITHLFVGGNIVETRKTSYADIAKSERLTEMLVELMQDQHKTMLRELIGGRCDQRIAERSMNAGTLNGPAPLNVEAGGQHRSSFGVSAPESASPPAARAPSAPPPPSIPQVRPPTMRPTVPAMRPAASEPADGSIFSLPPPRPGAPSVPAGVHPPPMVIPRFGPPPAAPTYRAPPPAAIPTRGVTPMMRPAPIAATGIDNVIQAETLQRAFESPNESAVDSIFGEDLISEKSLDEVILSYLAEDMQQ